MIYMYKCISSNILRLDEDVKTSWLHCRSDSLSPVTGLHLKFFFPILNSPAVWWNVAAVWNITILSELNSYKSLTFVLVANSTNPGKTDLNLILSECVQERTCLSCQLILTSSHPAWLPARAKKRKKKRILFHHWNSNFRLFRDKTTAHQMTLFKLPVSIQEEVRCLNYSALLFYLRESFHSESLIFRSIFWKLIHFSSVLLFSL